MCSVLGITRDFKKRTQLFHEIWAVLYGTNTIKQNCYIYVSIDFLSMKPWNMRKIRLKCEFQ